MLLGGCLGAAAFGIDAVTPVLPLLRVDFASDPGAIQWTLTLAMLGFAGGQIPAGLLSDRYGRRRVLMISLCGFVLASALASLMSELRWLLALRMAQGLSAAGMSVSARAVVRDLTRGVDAGAMMSSVTTVMALATVAAPLVGGLAGEVWGWRAVFIAVAGYGLIWVLPVRGLTSLAPRRRQSSPLRQLRSSARRFLRSRTSVRAALTNGLAFASVFAFVTVGALLAGEFYGVDGRLLGPAMAAVPLMIVASSQLSRVLVRRIGLVGQERVGGWLFLAAAIVMLACLGLAVPPLWLVWLGSMVAAFGFGLFVPVATARALESQPRSAGFAAALFGTVQSTCGVVASGLTAAIYNGSPNSLCLVMGFFSLAAAAAALLRGPSERS